MKTFFDRGLSSIWDFILTEYFIDAVRTTSSVVIPTALLFYLGYNHIAIGVGLGALLVAVSDTPGDVYERATALVISSVILSLVSLITAILLAHNILLAVLIAVSCFVFSMLSVFGSSAAAIGSMALVMMIFTIGLKPGNAPAFCCYILLGGLWHTLMTILHMRRMPYRRIRHALSECTREIATFLTAKASFYDEGIAVNDCFEEVITRHITVSEKQDALRSILLKDNFLIHSSDPRGLQLLQVGARVIDLYEQILAIHYDYADIRRMLAELDLLGPVNRMIKLMADEMKQAGRSMRTTRPSKPYIPVMQRTPLLTRQLTQAQFSATRLNASLLKQIITNFEMIDTSMQSIWQLLSGEPVSEQVISGSDAIRFFDTERFSLQQLTKHLSLRSPILRFSLRISLICLGAYMAITFVSHGKYSYWILLTIIIVARPGFNNTRRRNFQRITGTAIGIAIAFGILFFIHSFNIEVGLIVFFLLGYLSFLYVNYLISVIFVTLLAVMGLHLLGGNNNELLLERSYDTILGCAIALIAAFIFPFWEAHRLNDFMKSMLSANISYLQILHHYVAGEPVDIIAYKLARKRIFIASANLSRAYLHMKSEPQNDLPDKELFFDFQIVNHQLYASVAALFLKAKFNYSSPGSPGGADMVQQAIGYLEEGLCQLSGTNPALVKIEQEPLKYIPIVPRAYEDILSEQLNLISTLCYSLNATMGQLIIRQCD